MTTDIEGQQFGRLFVMRRVTDPRPGRFWFCMCSCGKPVAVRGSALRAGKTSSCGCSRTKARTMRKEREKAEKDTGPETYADILEGYWG